MNVEQHYSRMSNKTPQMSNKTPRMLNNSLSTKYVIRHSLFVIIFFGNWVQSSLCCSMTFSVPLSANKYRSGTGLINTCKFPASTGWCCPAAKFIPGLEQGFLSLIFLDRRFLNLTPRNSYRLEQSFFCPELVHRGIYLFLYDPPQRWKCRAYCCLRSLQRHWHSY